MRRLLHLILGKVWSYLKSLLGEVLSENLKIPLHPLLSHYVFKCVLIFIQQAHTHHTLPEGVKINVEHSNSLSILVFGFGKRIIFAFSVSAHHFFTDLVEMLIQLAINVSNFFIFMEKYICYVVQKKRGTFGTTFDQFYPKMLSRDIFKVSPYSTIFILPIQ